VTALAPLRGRRRVRRRQRRVALALAALSLLCATAVAMLAGALGFGLSSRAAAQTGGEIVAQTDDSVPARNVLMFGTGPGGETWGIGEVGLESEESWRPARYTEARGWSQEPVLGADDKTELGSPFKPDASVLAGAMTASGAGALLGSTRSEAGGDETRRETLLVRDGCDACSFHDVTPPSSEGEGALLKPGESLFRESRAPMLAALDEGEGRAGALVVPVNEKKEALEDGVLHWDGAGHWTREPIELLHASEENKEFRVLAIAASSPEDAWLVAELPQRTNPGAVTLFRRDTSLSTPTWKPVAPTPSGTPGEALTARGEPFTVRGVGEPPSALAQILTATSEGVWIDGERSDASARVTMFFRPTSPTAGKGEVQATWCDVPSGTPACSYELRNEEGAPPLPAGPSRSFAWTDSGQPYGDRVITGLREGVSLRLQGTEFQRVLSLGGGEGLDVGASRGAALASPFEGWLGSSQLPVHLTSHPAPNRLEQYPVPFRHALLAVAPQPGAAVGALSSEALVVGDAGEVARFLPGQGWQPESLFAPGGRLATPRLRAVAWPTAMRAYAVGDVGQMWLWRGETGLWESDPAAPRNFRSNLLGVAFDPSNPARGYAVGQQGVLLRYAKSWAQEELPPEVREADFLSITFAGSEAMVAFQSPPSPSATQARESGGLLINDGSGWRVDHAPTAGLGAGGQPVAVAALPDGGAALSGVNSAGEPVVIERQAAGAPWLPAPPFPGSTVPGSLALFREGGVLRVVASGALGGAAGASEGPPPPGFPPRFVRPLAPGVGYVRRQTASGWSDEEHDRNEIGPTVGEWKNYDLPLKPDPTAAVLLDPTGSVGWAVGGEINSSGLDTSDVARYPADGSAAAQTRLAPLAAAAGTAAFAIGGGAQCAAPCADRANAGIGPDVWLQTALARAGAVSGVRGFFYTGPRITTGETSTGKKTFRPPFGREYDRYAALLRSSPLPAFAAAAPNSDGAEGAGECLFEEAFAKFPTSFGGGAEAPGFKPADRSGEPCASAGAQPAYYALDSIGSSGGAVRVIVLDDVADVGPTQRAWLTKELAGARGAAEPSIVIGSVDVAGQMKSSSPPTAAAALALAQALLQGGASAYFFDAPENNISVPLRVGGESIPSYGSGTLGYISHLSARRHDFTGHSGFLVAQVETSARDPVTNRAPMHVRLIPTIGELALEARDGVLLRRSQTALFDALARRPRAGCLATGQETACTTDPYIPIPANCVGAACAAGIFPEYTFTSSRPDIGDFVEPNLASPDPRAVLLGPGEQPIEDTASGLFCAYNAGTTVATISAGELSASLTITVQPGSVRRPCGTVPLKELPARPTSTAPPPPAPAGSPPSQAPPPIVPVPPPPPAATAPPAHVPVVPPFVAVPAAPLSALIPFVPPPPPTPARPTPPSGTSSVQAVEKEEEEEEATESVGNQAVAYRASDHEPSPAYLLGLIVLAAFAGASVGRRPRRGSRRAAVALATIDVAAELRREEASRGVRRW
jgi:hypothetical protein